MTNKYFVILALSVSSLIAKTPNKELPSFSTQLETKEGAKVDLKGGVGFRTDFVQWDVRGGRIDVLSELTWRNTQILQFSFAPQITLPNRVVLLGDFKLGSIVGGTSQDSDWCLPGRQGEWSRTKAKTKGWSGDASIGVGYSIQATNKLEIIPVVGVEFHSLNLNDHDDKVLIDTISHSMVGKTYKGPMSHYHLKTYGPWAGLKAKHQLSSKLTLDGGLNLHLTHVNGVGDWYHREDFAHPKSFEQNKWGPGVSGQIGLTYAKTDKLSFFVNLEGKYQHLKRVNETIYRSDGEIDRSPRVNNLKWASGAITVGFKYRF